MRVLYLCVGMNDLGGTSSHFLNISQNVPYSGIDAQFLIGTKISDQLYAHFRESPVPVVIEEGYKRWGYIPFLYILVRRLRRERIQVVHSFQLQSDILAAVAGVLAGVPVRISSFEGRLLYGSSPVRRWVLKILDRMIRSTITCNIFISQHLLEIYGSAHHIPLSKRKLIYLGLPKSWFEGNALIGHAPGRRRVGFVGRIDAEKGYELFIEAVRVLIDRGVKADFVMVGHGQLYSDALRRIREHHLEDKIVMRGWCDDMKAELGQLDIVALPSHEEGLSFVALEALSQRRVVIAARVGGLPEIIQDAETGFLVEKENPQALADKLAQVIDEWPRWNLLGDKGYEFVHKEFTIQREIKNFFDLYQAQLHALGILS